MEPKTHFRAFKPATTQSNKWDACTILNHQTKCNRYSEVPCHFNQQRLLYQSCRLALTWISHLIEEFQPVKKHSLLLFSQEATQNCVKSSSEFKWMKTNPRITMLNIMEWWSLIPSWLSESTYRMTRLKRCIYPKTQDQKKKDQGPETNTVTCLICCPIT